MECLKLRVYDIMGIPKWWALRTAYLGVITESEAVTRVCCDGDSEDGVFGAYVIFSDYMKVCFEI